MIQEIIVFTLISLALFISIRFFVRSISGRSSACGNCDSDCSQCNDIVARIGNKDFTAGNN